MIASHRMLQMIPASGRAALYYGLAMSVHTSLSRRSFLALSAAAPLAMALPAGKNIPIGLELFSVRGELAKDLTGTVTKVARMGYQVVEFFAPYFSGPRTTPGRSAGFSTISAFAVIPPTTADSNPSPETVFRKPLI